MKRYVLSNSLNEKLYYSNPSEDTNSLSKAKVFSDRNFAEKFLLSRGLDEKYLVKLIVTHKLNEMNYESSVNTDIESSVNDCKDIIDTTIELLELYKSDSLNEEILEGSNIEDVYEKLRKIQKYMSGIIFYPSFYNSKNERPTPTIDPDGGIDSSGQESSGDSNAE